MVSNNNNLLHNLPKAVFPYMLPPNVFLLNLRDTDFFKSRPPTLVPFNLNVLIAAAALAIFIVAMFCLLYGFGVLFIYSQLNAAETTVQGEIIAHRAETLGRFNQSPAQYIIYRFVPPEQSVPYVKELYVSQETYDRLKDGSSVTVNYLPGDPTISTLLGEDVAPNLGIVGSVFAVVGLVATLTSGFYLLPLLQQMWSEARLRQQGCLLTGHVLACQRYFTLPVTSLPPGDHDPLLGAMCYIELSYSFHTPDGKQLRGVGNQKRSDLAKTRLPTFGTPVVVLYVDEKHHRVL